MRCLTGLLLSVLSLFSIFTAHAQDSLSLDRVLKLQDKYTQQISSKVNSLTEKFDQTSEKALAKFMAQQEKIAGKLARLDSNAAKNVLDNARSKYDELQQNLKEPQKLNQYIPYLDTLKTSLKFLEQKSAAIGGGMLSGKKISATMNQVKQLESRMQKAEEVRKFIREQKAQLKEQLMNHGLTKEIKGLNKQVYYYQQQLQDYKEVLKDKKKIEKKAVQLLGQVKPFQEFMKKNSFLASLFNINPDPADPAYQANLAGLQTRSQVTQGLQQRFSVGGPNAMAQVNNSIKEAQGKLNELKNKLLAAGASDSDTEIPDFKPNQEKTKTFLKRLEYSVNFQSQRSTNLFPASSDIGLGVGYKLHQNGIVGLGLGSKIGWGKGWNNIDVTYQGVSLRSYLDWKLKGSFYLSGGYEMNYRSAFKDIEVLRNYSAWQQSGLAGISKVISLKNKFLKKTKAQLLWDFLSYQQIPKTQAVLFRFGYSF